MSGYILQITCLDGDYKSITPNFYWAQIKKKVGGYFFFHGWEIYVGCPEPVYLGRQKDSCINGFSCLWLHSTKPYAAPCLCCKSLSHPTYCVWREGGNSLWQCPLLPQLLYFMAEQIHTNMEWISVWRNSLHGN